MGMFQGPLPHHLQCHFKLILSRNCAVTLPGCGHAAPGLTCGQLWGFAGCLKAHQIKALIAGSAYTKLQTRDRWQTATHTPKTKHILHLTELSHNMDILSKIIRSTILSRRNAGI